MTREELIEILDGYEKSGWIVLALPPDFANSLLGRPATPIRALELSGRIREMERKLEESGLQ